MEASIQATEKRKRASTKRGQGAEKAAADQQKRQTLQGAEVGAHPSPSCPLVSAPQVKSLP